MRVPALPILVGLLLATSCTWPARAQTPSGGSCPIPDRVEMADAGSGMAVVTYYNSPHSCSKGFNAILTTPNGISARVIVDINVDGDFERLVVIPQSDGYFAIPPDHLVEDGGEPVEIVIMGGMS